LLKQMQN